MTNNRVLIVGGRSKTAEAMLRIFPAETDWKLGVCSSGVSTNEESNDVHFFPIDYSDHRSLKAAVLKFQPSHIVNLAAYTDVDGCEDDKQRAWAANVTWVEHVARICRVVDAKMVHFSTDYVFDGLRGPYTEEDTPSPISYYGKSKLASENVCKAGHIPYTIVRTNVIYGLSLHEKVDFVTWVLRKLEAGQPFNVVTDQYSNPTITDDLAWATVKLIDKNRQGVYHVAGAEWLSRFDLAVKIAEFFKHEPRLVMPCLTSDLQQKAKRPLKAGLVPLKAETDLGVKFANVEQGLTLLRHLMYNVRPRPHGGTGPDLV